jgi:hypothetical protein
MTIPYGKVHQGLAMTYRSVKPMVSASHADGRGSTPGAGQILPPLSTHPTDVLDPGVPHCHKR